MSNYTSDYETNLTEITLPCGCHGGGIIEHLENATITEKLVGVTSDGDFHEEEFSQDICGGQLWFECATCHARITDDGGNLITSWAALFTWLTEKTEVKL